VPRGFERVVLAQHSEQNVDQRTLTVGTAAPEDRQYLLGGQTGEAIAQQPLQIRHLVAVVVEDLTEKPVPQARFRQRIERRWAQLRDQVLRPMLAELASPEVDGAIGDIE